MPTGDDAPIFDDLMRFKPEGMTPNAWAMKAGVSRTVWSDMRRHGNPARRTLEKLLAAAGSSLAEFEALRIGTEPPEAARIPALADRRSAWGSPQLPTLPLFATTVAADRSNPAGNIELTALRMGEVIDRIPRPVSLANDAGAYAITVVGDSMWPRYRPGRRIAVSPKAPVAVGDDVLVKLNTDGLDTSTAAVVPVLIKELVRRSSGGVELRQFKPDMTFHVDDSDIASIEKVLGELI